MYSIELRERFYNEKYITHTRKEDTNRKNKKTTCQFWERTPQVSNPQNVHCTKSNIDIYKKKLKN